MLPAGYDPASGEWFDIFPEAPTPRDWAHWTNPGATANSQCLACHMTGYAAGYDAAAETYATTWHEVGVGCEACHGAAGEHVEVRQRGGIDAYGAPDATRPGPGCPLCHDLRVEIAAGWMPDAEPTEHFAPELLDSAAFHADGQPAGEVYEWTSFAMTAMAREGVRCADCHEPHDGRLRQEGNALCLGCHEARLDTTEHTHHPAGSDGAACVGCHMPEQVFMQRDRRRDHRIARPDPALAEAVGAPDACTTCHTDRPQAWATAATARWWGTSGAMQAARDDALALLAGRVGDHIAVAPLVAMVGRLGWV